MYKIGSFKLQLKEQNIIIPLLLKKTIYVLNNTSKKLPPIQPSNKFTRVTPNA